MDRCCPVIDRSVKVLFAAGLAVMIVAAVGWEETESSIRMHRSGIKLSVPSGLTSPTPLSLLVTAGTGLDFPQAIVTIAVHSSKGDSVVLDTLWEGSTKAGERVELSCSLASLPIGRYLVSAAISVADIPPGSGGGNSDEVWVEVTDVDWSVSDESFLIKDLREIVSELKRLGLDTCNSEQLRIAAPELERRMAELGVRRPAKLSVPQSHLPETSLAGTGESTGSLGLSRTSLTDRKDSLRLKEYFREQEAAERQRLFDSLSAADSIANIQRPPPIPRPEQAGPAPHRPPPPVFDGPSGHVLSPEEATRIRESRSRAGQLSPQSDSASLDTIDTGNP